MDTMLSVAASGIQDLISLQKKVLDEGALSSKM
jgi:hypothetical protein